MTDIVGRLRSGADGLWSTNLAHIPETMTDAADEIERLRRDLSHAKACTEVWMNRFRKADDLLGKRTTPPESP
jgi:hypothetical protein